MKALTYRGGSPCGFMPKKVSVWYQKNAGWFMWDYFPAIDPEDVPSSIKVRLME